MDLIHRLDCLGAFLESIHLLSHKKHLLDLGFDSVWSLLGVKKEYAETMGLTEEEMEIFSGAGSSFFGKSLQENEKALEHDITRLEEVIGLAQKEQKEKQKVYQTAAVMCGLIVILVFL